MRWRTFALALLVAAGAAACKPSGGSGQANVEDAFRDRSDAEVTAALEAAKTQARSEGKRVLLEFVAPWCADCREVARLAAEEPAASVLREKYVVVPVNIGKFDRNKALIRAHDVKVIAALVVLDPEGKRLAKTTLEPISNKDGLTSSDLAAWLRSPRER
jgi:thiol:disulfide interchange protein